MKLRFQSNSIRLRLKRSEVDRLAEIGRLEEEVVMGNEHKDIFRYVLEASHAVSSPAVQLNANGLLVQLPVGTVSRWATSDEVGIEAFLAVQNPKSLQVLIEKDFACLDRTTEENVDTFPHPLAGTKC